MAFTSISLASSMNVPLSLMLSLQYFQLPTSTSPFSTMSDFDKNCARKSHSRQTTLLGWKRGADVVGTDESKKSKRDSSTSDRLSIESGSRNSLWENKSLPNGPMILLRNTVGGIKASERQSTKSEFSSLPDWNDNVTFQIFGKECRMRRRVCQYSSGGNVSYSYSGLKNISAPNFPGVVYRIKCQVEDLMMNHLLDAAANHSNSMHMHVSPEFMDEIKAVKESRDAPIGSRREIFNYCLLNHYRNGEEYMSYHTDDESSLHANFPIASVSFGSTRNFDIRPRNKDEAGKKSRLDRIPLGDGDLLVMFPPMQEYYEHGIPVEKRVVGDRINLTFRRVRKVK
ncbi:hypothetical protein ACHAXN_004075 [Cyclotella atomus]